MKITTFNPQIITKDADAIEKLFEELGFEKKHNPKGIGELNVTGIRMKDANGFHLDISQPNVEMPRDIVAIRMNVDDFDEAYEMLTAHGFKNFYGDQIVGTKSAKSAIMIGMYGGQEVKVKLAFKNEFVGVIIDRFGKDVMIHPAKQEGWSETFVNVALSDQFLGWIFSLGTNVKIIEPAEVVQRFKNMWISLRT